jgi:hypothetical protein
MSDEQREQRDVLDDAVEDAWEPCEQSGIDLITTKPTTPAGIITAIRRIQIQMRDDGTYMPQGVEFEYTEGSAGDSRAAMGWINAFLDTLADAATELDLAGKAVQYGAVGQDDANWRRHRAATSIFMICAGGGNVVG